MLLDGSKFAVPISHGNMILEVLSLAILEVLSVVQIQEPFFF